MILDIWFINTITEEKQETLSFLKEQKAYNIEVTSGENGLEYKCVMAVDCEEDIQRAIKVMLYYNDRSVSTLEGFVLSLPQKRIS